MALVDDGRDEVRQHGEVVRVVRVAHHDDGTACRRNRPDRHCRSRARTGGRPGPPPPARLRPTGPSSRCRTRSPRRSGPCDGARPRPSARRCRRSPPLLRHGMTTLISTVSSRATASCASARPAPPLRRSRPPMRRSGRFRRRSAVPVRLSTMSAPFGATKFGTWNCCRSLITSAIGGTASLSTCFSSCATQLAELPLQKRLTLSMAGVSADRKYRVVAERLNA